MEISKFHKMPHNCWLLLVLVCLAQLSASYPLDSEELIVLKETATEFEQQDDCTTATEQLEGTERTDDLIVLSLQPQRQVDSAEQAQTELPMEFEGSTVQMPYIDVSVFLKYIPVHKVKAIVTYYYRNDAEVRRAFGFLNGPEFQWLQKHTLALPEVKALLGYFKSNGLDLLELIDAANERARTQIEVLVKERIQKFMMRNEILQPGTIATDLEQVKEMEQGPGLLGLVDSVLEALPTEDMVQEFFVKFTEEPQYAALMSSFTEPEFEEIRNNLQNSMALRNLIFTLHNNGIDITRIVDSLKRYFLGAD